VSLFGIITTLLNSLIFFSFLIRIFVLFSTSSASNSTLHVLHLWNYIMDTVSSSSARRLDLIYRNLDSLRKILCLPDLTLVGSRRLLYLSVNNKLLSKFSNNFSSAYRPSFLLDFDLRPSDVVMIWLLVFFGVNESCLSAPGT
jgi:hypothetical protein